jgi:hypothetical protein
MRSVIWSAKDRNCLAVLRLSCWLRTLPSLFPSQHSSRFGDVHVPQRNATGDTDTPRHSHRLTTAQENTLAIGVESNLQGTEASLGPLLDTDGGIRVGEGDLISALSEGVIN